MQDLVRVYRGLESCEGGLCSSIQKLGHGLGSGGAPEPVSTAGPGHLRNSNPKGIEAFWLQGLGEGTKQST